MKNEGKKVNNSKVSNKNIETIKKENRKISIDDKKKTKDLKKESIMRAPSKKGKLIPELENENISNISKNVSSNNCETNMIISENLNQISKKTTKSIPFKDDLKELDNMKSLLVQFHYMNALLEDSYSKQTKLANVCNFN